MQDVTDYTIWHTAGGVKLTYASWNEQFSQEQQKVCHLIQDSHPAMEAEKAKYKIKKEVLHTVTQAQSKSTDH